MAEASTKTMKDLVKEILPDGSDSDKFLSYINTEKRKEAAAKKKKPESSTPVTDNSDEQLLALCRKFKLLGLPIDGINVVITGREMAMVTFNGYKKKVKLNHPDATFDIQLVREDDTFSFEKADGFVTYTHKFGDPFEEKPIKGAYCAMRIGGRDYIEFLGRKDFSEMKNGSKQKYLWERWESEFFLKSVIKRACKRHFNDEIADIEAADNEDYGQRDDIKHTPAADAQAAAKERLARSLEKAKEIEDLDESL